MTTEEQRGFDRGIVYVMARLCETFDQPSMAVEIALNAKVDFSICDEYDVTFLRKEDPTIPRGKNEHLIINNEVMYD